MIQSGSRWARIGARIPCIVRKLAKRFQMPGSGDGPLGSWGRRVPACSKDIRGRCRGLVGEGGSTAACSGCLPGFAGAFGSIRRKRCTIWVSAFLPPRGAPSLAQCRATRCTFCASKTSGPSMQEGAHVRTELNCFMGASIDATIDEGVSAPVPIRRALHVARRIRFRKSRALGGAQRLRRPCEKNRPLRSAEARPGLAARFDQLSERICRIACSNASAGCAPVSR